MKKLSFLLLSVCLGLSAHATPSATSLNQLAEVLPYEAVFFEAFVTPISEERAVLAYNLANDTSLSDKQRTDALTAFDNYAKTLIESLDTPAIKESLKTAYINTARNTYTQEEVNALLAFYGSPAGQSALEKEDGVLRSYMQTVTPTGINIIETHQKTHLIPLQDTIKRILNK